VGRNSLDAAAAAESGTGCGATAFVGAGRVDRPDERMGAVLDDAVGNGEGVGARSRENGAADERVAEAAVFCLFLAG